MFVGRAGAGAERQDDADRDSGAAERHRAGHRPAARRNGDGVLAQPIWQHLRPQRHGRHADALPAGSGQGDRRGGDRRARRRLHDPFDGERGLGCRQGARRQGRGRVRAQIPAHARRRPAWTISAIDGSRCSPTSGRRRGRTAEAMAASLAPQIADARAAFALVRRRAAEWHVDPDRIGMVGFSAGAVLTMATTLAGRMPSPPSSASSMARSRR